MSEQYDFVLSGGGSIFLLKPVTDEAREWVEENVSREGFQPYWPMVCVEWRYLDALLDGIDGMGLTVDAIERALG